MNATATQSYDGRQMNARPSPYAWIILPLGILLLQHHGIVFWTTMIAEWPGWGLTLLAHPWDGWGLSVGLEVVNLWSWPRWRRPAWLVIAAVTTVLLVAGPLYQVSFPLAQSLLSPRGSKARTAEIGLLDSEILVILASLATYRKNSETRVGWQVKIDEAEAALTEKWDRRRELVAAEAGNAEEIGWIKAAVIVGQLAAILILQAAIVLSITEISMAFQGRAKASPPVSKPADNGASVKNPESALVIAYAHRHALTSNVQVADSIAVSPRDLSLYVNHRKLVAESKRTLPQDTFNSITAKLQPTRQPQESPKSP